MVDVVSTLTVKSLTFQNSSGITLSNYTLYNSDSSGEVVADFIIELSRFDLNTIKRIPDLLTGISDTYLSILPQFVSDVFQNPVQIISEGSALLVSNFFPDIIPPQLERFSINMTQETITLHFSETVQSNSLNTSQITLLSLPSLVSTNVTLHQTLSLYDDDFLIVFPLDFDDLNLLKQYTDLATSEFNTYISVTSYLIRDMNSNFISSINESQALRIDSFYPDLIRPILVNYTLDLDGSPMISLTFSETVNSISIDPLQILIQDFHSAQNLRLFNGGFTISPNSTVIVLLMFKDDIEYIKQNFRLATSINTTFLRHNTSLIQDMNSNYVVPIYDGMGLQANLYIQDTTRPYLTHFELDMNNGMVVLYFSESMNIETFLSSSITFQANIFVINDDSKLLLSGGNVTTGNDTKLIFYILKPDLDQIKLLQNLAVSVSSIFLSFTELMIKDMNLNNVIPQNNGNASIASNFVNDTTPPILSAFNIDFNGSLMFISLYFSETVNTSSLNVSELVLTDKPYNSTLNLPNSETITFNLSGGTFVELNDITIYVTLLFEDSNAIKRLPLCTESMRQNNCFLSFSSHLIRDMNGNNIQSISIVNPLKAQSFIPDRYSPFLLQFIQFDYNSETVILQFDETVNISTLDPTQISFQRWGFDDGTLSPFNIIRLTGGFNFTQLDDITILFHLNDFDLNRIKRDPDVCPDSTRCFIRFLPQAIKDMAGNLARALLDPTNQQIRRFEYPEFLNIDTTGPFLVGFSIDLDLLNISLTFDETIEISDFDPRAITIHNSRFNSTESHTLTGTALGTAPSTVENWIYVNFILSEFDVIQLKFLENLAINKSTTFLSISNQVIEDVSNNKPLSTLASGGIIPHLFIPDVTGPFISQFDVYLTEKYILLTSNEPILLISLNPTFVTLQSAVNISVSYHETLINGNFSYYEPVFNHKRVIRIDLYRFNLLPILVNNNFLTSNVNSYFSHFAGLFLDVFGNPSQGIRNDSALQVSNFVGDNLAASLESFTIDLNVGSMTLYFDDVILVESFDPTGIILQNNLASIATSAYTLTSQSMSISDSDYYLTVEFSDQDLNTLKKYPILATMENNTCLVILGFPNSPLGDSSNHIVTPSVDCVFTSSFIPDITRPILRSFIVDMDNGEMVLLFSETMRASSLKVENIALLNTINAANSATIFLLSGGNSSSIDDTVLTINFLLEDLNIIKRNSPAFYTSENTSFIYFNNLTLFDMNFNPIIGVSSNVARMATTFIPDTTDPYLISYSLDLSREVLVLNFSETINAGSFSFNEIYLQSSFDGGTVFQLSGGVHTMQNTTRLTLYFSFDDLNNIKRLTALAIDSTTTFLFAGPMLIYDMNSNYFMPISTSKALSVSSFIPDLIPPELESFDLDLNTNQLKLYFTETMLVHSIAIERFVLVNKFTNWTNSYSFNYGNWSNFDNRSILISFSKADSDTIRLYTDLATSQNNTYLYLLEMGIADMNQNYLRSTIQKVKIFTSDRSRPTLLGFSLDLDSALLTLTFSETVLSTSLNSTQLTLHSDSHVTSTTLNLTLGNTFSMFGSNTTIVLKLTINDLNELKRIAYLADSQNSTYVSATRYAVTDMNFNLLIPILLSEPLPIFEYTFDSTGPMLNTFDFDLNTGTLVITFSETVDTSSFNPEGFTLQSHVRLTETYNTTLTLRVPTSTTTLDSTVVYVKLSTEDLNEVKRLVGLGDDKYTTYINVEYFALRDTSSNLIQPILSNNATPVFRFIPDTNNPILISYSLDINTGFLTLLFSEVVNVSTLQVDGISLQSTDNISNISQFHILTDEVSLLFSNDSTLVRIYIGFTDLNTIKFLSHLATTVHDTYLSIERFTIMDMSSLSVVAIPKEQAFNVLVFSPDEQGPILQIFNLNLSDGTVTLFFDETIDIRSFDPAYIQLMASSNSSIVSLDGSFTARDHHVAILDIEYDVLNMLKLDTSLATSSSNTYLTILPDAVFDLSFIPNGAQLRLLQVSLFYEDLVSPELESFFVDLTLGRITFNFNEPVLTTSFDIFALSLQSSEYSSYMGAHQLIHPVSLLLPNNTSNLNGLSITVTLSMEDLNIIKSNPKVFTNLNTSYISFSSNFVTDLNYRFISPISSNSALRAAGYIDDTLRPSLFSFDFDLDSGHLVLFFTETMNSTTIRIHKLFFQLFSYITNSNHSYSLQTESLITVEPSLVIKIQLNRYDLNELKRRAIAVNFGTTFLTFDDMTVQDMNMNYAYSRINGLNAAQVHNFTADRTAPFLTDFDLDMNMGTLSLLFSETISGVSIVVQHLTLQDRRNVSDIQYFYTLTSNSFNVSPIDNTGTVIELGLSDLNGMKQLQTLAVSSSSTYLYISVNFLTDISGNHITPISNTDAKRVRYFRQDITRPSLLRFDFDFNTEFISFYFTEIVDISTIKIDMTLSFSSSSSSSLGQSYNISGGVVLGGDSTLVEIKLTYFDLNNIKNMTQLATSEFDLYLRIYDESFIQDMIGTFVEPTQLAVTSFTPDTKPPYLLYFNLDLNLGDLILFYSEIVNIHSIDVSQFNIHNMASGSSVSHKIGSATVSSYNSPIISLQLSSSDQNSIKKLHASSLAISKSTTYLSFQANSIRDMAGNLVLPIYNDSAVLVSSYISDTKLPTLSSFDLDLNLGILKAILSEVVNIDTFSPIEIILQSVRDSSNQGHQFHKLSGGMYSSTNSTAFTLYITGPDLNVIKRLSKLAIDTQSTFLTCSPELIQDTSGNQLRSISTFNALQVSDLTLDTTRPSLLNFSIDMDEGFIILSFDETVDVSTLIFNQIMLVNRLEYIANLSSISNFGNQYHVLTIGMALDDDGILVMIQLNSSDLNEIKRKDLCTNLLREKNCYIKISNSTIKDIQGNAVFSLDTIAIQPNSFIPDTTPPFIMSFSEFNLFNQTITLQYDETVNISTFDFTSITLQTFFENPEFSITLTGGFILNTNSHIITIRMSEVDITTIKSHPKVCRQRNLCWLSLSGTSVEDMAGNPAVTTFNGKGIYVLRFVKDTFPPYLLYWDISVDNGTVWLYFNEPITLNSPGILPISFHPSNDSFLNYTLMEETTYIVSIKDVILTLSLTDLLSIRETDFMKSNNDSYITFPSILLSDTALPPNNVIPVFLPFARLVRYHYPDKSGPILLRSILNLNIDVLTLVFDEPIIPSSINFTYITLSSSNLISATTIQNLTGGVIINLDFSNYVNIQLTRSDLILIKNHLGYKSVFDRVYTSLEMSTVLDTQLQPNNVVYALSTEYIFDLSSASLESFDINIDLGVITLTFNDVMDATTMNVDGITIQNVAYASMPNRYALQYSSTSTLFNGYIFVINMGVSDLNVIKEYPEIATNLNTSFITLYAYTINDVYGRDVHATTDENIVQASSFIQDSTPPHLINFTLDLNYNKLVLTFSETIDLFSFNTSLFAFHSTRFGSKAKPISDLNSILRLNLFTFEIFLPQADINLLTSNISHATSESNTFITLYPNIIKDTNGNFLNVTQVLRASSLIPDTIPPTLISFSLDLTYNLLTLMFSEVVNSSSLISAHITIFSINEGVFSGHGLINSSTSPKSYNDTILISLGTTDLNSLKENSVLAISKNTTFITLSENVIEDMSGNANELLSPKIQFMVSSYTEDTLRPNLLLFSLNLSSEIISLTFSETVSILSIDLTQMKLIDNLSYSYSLSGGIIISSRDYHVIFVQLSTPDLNNIKRNKNVATILGNAYLAVNAGVITDTSENYVLPTILAAQDFYPDLIAPIVVSFSLDLNSNLLIISFSETVLISSTLNISDLAFRSALSPISQFSTLFDSYYNNTDSEILTIFLSFADVNSIQSEDNLCTNSLNCFISYSSNFTSDINFNPIVPLLFPNDLLRVSELIPDLVSPTLVIFSFDLDSGLLSFTFNEVILYNSVSVTDISLQDGVMFKSFYKLKTIFVVNINSYIIITQLSDIDLNNVKQIRSLYTSPNNTFISITGNAFLDTNLNSIQPISNVSALPVSQFVHDSTNPMLHSFSFDVDMKFLILTFTETVDITTFNGSQILVLNNVNGSISVQLSDAMVVNIFSEPVIYLLLFDSDLNHIKSMPYLAKTRTDTYLSFTSSLIRDMSGLSVVAIKPSAALPVLQYFDDLTGPILEYFDLDMDEGVLVLHFDEVVRVSSIRLHRYTLMNNPNMANFTYTLNGEVIASGDSASISLKLDNNDILGIKTNLGLATNRNNTWLFVDDAAARDTSSRYNPNKNITISVRQFVSDSTGPQIVISDVLLDLDVGILALAFDEPVSRNSLNATGISFQSDSDSDSTTLLTLTGGNTISPDGFVIIITLTRNDLDAIKQNDNLCTSFGMDCYLSADSITIVDNSGNSLIPIIASNSQLITQVVNDTDLPGLDNFSLDVNSGILILTFSETVNSNSLRVGEIRLQTTRDDRSSMYQFHILTNSTVSNLVNSTTVIISLSIFDLNSLKVVLIGEFVNSTWLVASNRTVTDMNGNINYPIISNINTLNVLNLAADTTSPILSRFTLDLDQGYLTLYFDESVDVSTLVINLITLQTRTNSFSYTLSDSSNSLVDGPSVSIFLSITDSNNIKRIMQIVTTRNDSFISFPSHMITDMFKNYITPIVSSYPTQVSIYTQDRTPPTILQFDIDLTAEQLTLYFSETVRYLTLVASQITLQQHSSGGVFYVLTNATVITRLDDPILILAFTQYDLNNIKYLMNILTDRSNTYISITARLIQDMNGNYVESVLFNNSLHVSNFIEDNTVPEVLNFHLDMDTSSLHITFSETVNRNSFQPNLLTIQNNKLPDIFLALSGGIISERNSTEITIYLDAPDSNFLKQHASIATSTSSTFITFSYGIVRDMNNNAIPQVNNISAIQALNFTNDFTPPKLLSFSFDLDNAQLYLSFSESINGNSFDPTQLTLQAQVNASNHESGYTLTGGNFTHENFTSLVMTLIKPDLDELKIISALGTSINSTFVSHTHELIKDMNRNFVVPIFSSMALQAIKFSDDTTPPIFQSWQIDLDAGEFSLSFSETVNSSSSNFSRITLTDRPIPDNYSISFVLEQGDILSPDGTVIGYKFTFDDLNLIKKLNLCTDFRQHLDCYISLSSGSIMDMSRVPLLEHVNQSIQVSIYTRDSSQPELSQFLLFNASSGVVAITFSETVNISSFNISKISLQRWAFDDNTLPRPFPIVQLNSSTLLTKENGRTVSFIVADYDLNLIKTFTSLCISTLSCHVRFSENLLRDMSNNAVIKVIDDTISIPVSQYAMIFIPDSVDPSLIAFSIDLTTQSVILTFDETVDVSSFNSLQITFLNSRNYSQLYMLTAAGSLLSIENWIYIEFLISNEDLQVIKQMEKLATNVNDTYISVTSSLILDMNQNTLNPILINNAIMASAYQRDSIPPQLMEFILNLQEHHLLLTFDEPVQLNTIQPTYISLSSTSDISTSGTSI